MKQLRATQVGQCHKYHADGGRRLVFLFLSVTLVFLFVRDVDAQDPVAGEKPILWDKNEAPTKGLSPKSGEEESVQGEAESSAVSSSKREQEQDRQIEQLQERVLRLEKRITLDEHTKARDNKILQ